MQKKSQKNIVLDAWTLLALIFKKEPAADKVKEVFDSKGLSSNSVYISWINIGEVFYTIARRKGLEEAEFCSRRYTNASYTL